MAISKSKILKGKKGVGDSNQKAIHIMDWFLKQPIAKNYVTDSTTCKSKWNKASHSCKVLACTVHFDLHVHSMLLK